MPPMQGQPAGWNDQHASGRERATGAMRRDWEQTKHDLHLKGGHELNQNIGDTVKQVAGKEAIPPADKLNPPKVIGDWSDVELPMGYGYSARDKYGREHQGWT